MPVLHFGVIDYPYVDDAANTVPAAPKPTKSGKPRKARVRKRAGPVTPNQTTGDVAEILEAKYHIMETFSKVHEDELAEMVADSMAGAIKNMMAGQPSPADPLAQAEADIEQTFRNFLTNKEMDSLGYPGVPTEASLKGVSHRFKGKRGAPGRPSFIDTGAYEGAMRVWTDAPGSESAAEARPSGVAVG